MKNSGFNEISIFGCLVVVCIYIDKLKVVPSDIPERREYMNKKS